MEAIIQDVLDRQLQDFAGAEVRGRLAIADEWVNEVLAEVMTAARTPPATDTPNHPPAAAAAAPDIDPRQLLSWLDIRQLAYRTTAGRTVLDLEVGLPE